MNVVIAILLLSCFLAADIYFVNMIWKKISVNVSDVQSKKIMDSAYATTLSQVASARKIISDLPSTAKLMKFQTDMKIAAQKDNATAKGKDMYETGQCHWCENGSQSYFNNKTKSFFCLDSLPTTDSGSWSKFNQDPCSCTKETEDVNQYGCCFPCCDNLNMYKNNSSGEIQCFLESGPVDGYTKIQNICPTDTRGKCPTYPIPFT